MSIDASHLFGALNVSSADMPPPAAEAVELGVHMGWRAVLSLRMGIITFWNVDTGTYVTQARVTDPILSNTPVRAAALAVMRAQL